MHAVVGGYHINNVKFVAAFDVDAKKVGLDLAEAIWASENNTIKFSDVAKTGVAVHPSMDLEELRALAAKHNVHVQQQWGTGKIIEEMFEALAEHELMAPTFVTGHPVEISPLARVDRNDPFLTERFELYITGREFGNGFSELNDAEDQAARFHAQVAAKDDGDDEAMYYDHDFVRALEYGMPPAGGCGIGIDRLMMLLTDSASIRDVILFPALRHVQE
jgi:lysyl-tRNA synthetase class 2